MMRKGGFSLFELLLTFVILGIVASIGIRSGVRVITRGGHTAGIISAGGAVSGVGRYQGTNIPAPPPGLFHMLWRIKPRFCSRHRSEAQETLAKRAVGEILARRHIHKYVQDQNLETSVAARFLKPQ